MKKHYLNNYGEFVARTFGDQGSDVMNLVHASLGISGEAGEIVDSIKKTWLYGKAIDRANLIEEIGDLLFYMQALCTVIGVSLDDAKAANIDKLLKRFPDGKFTQEHALERRDKKINDLIVVDEGKYKCKCKNNLFKVVDAKTLIARCIRCNGAFFFENSNISKVGVFHDYQL